MTVLGKVLVFVTTMFALFALSMAIWSYSEERNLTEQAQRISEEIYKVGPPPTGEKREIDLQFEQLRTLIQEAAQGSRKMQYDPGDPYAREVNKTVRQIKDDIRGLETSIAELTQQWNAVQTELITQVNELSSVRRDVLDGLAEQKRLRETISPDRAVNPQAQPLREVTRGAWSEMVATDRRITENRPTLVSEIMLLMGLQQRHEELKKRLDQLKQQQQGNRGDAAAALHQRRGQ
jgi:septal ring factor EnvC (AmiA/AmiB activator)